jgi:uncharacterized protein
MDVFGECWRNHDVRIRDSWNAIASDDDLLLIAGDISWAMTLDEAKSDLEFLATLRGRKLLLKGNHDYWWSSISRMRSGAPPSIEFLQNDTHIYGLVAIIGSRGWHAPAEGGTAEDLRLYAREVQRFRLSAAALATRNPRLVIAMTHYPPLMRLDEESPMSLAIEESGAAICVYGHLHGNDIPTAPQGVRNGVDYRLVSADAVDFCPALVCDL